MSTKSREVIFGSRIAGAKIRAQGARDRATQAVREADRADAEAWSIRMEGYGGPPAAGHADLEDRGRAEMPIMPDAAIFAAGAHDQVDRRAADGALRLGASRRGAVRDVDLVLKSTVVWPGPLIVGFMVFVAGR